MFNRGRVIATNMITPTVKWFQVQLLDGLVGPVFKPGQWADVYIPNTELIGGYSMCSTPKQLIEQKTFDLAVKRSDKNHPPTVWMSDQCTVGTEFKFAFGGEVYMDLNKTADNPLVLVAGGVGINPLYSMLCTSLESSSSLTRPITLLYTASSVEELQFREKIVRLAEEHNSFSAYFFSTRSNGSQTKHDVQSKTIKARRICTDDFKFLQQDAEYNDSSKPVIAYLCGPNEMMQTVEGYLIEAGVDKDNINYEKWW